MEEFKTIFLGVISCGVYAILLEFLRSNSTWFPSPLNTPEYIKPISQNYSRTKNRANLKLSIFNIVYYFITYLITYMAIIMPPMLKNIFSNDVVYLSDARFIGHLLPDVEIGSNYIQFSSIAIALVIYPILLIIVTKISLPISSIVDKFKHVDFYQWRAIQMMIFAFFAFFLALISIYIFNDITLIDALFTLLVFVFLGIALTSNSRK